MILLKKFETTDQVNEFLIKNNYSLVDFKIDKAVIGHSIFISYETQPQVVVKEPVALNYDNPEEILEMTSYLDDLIQLVDDSNEEEHKFFHKKEGVWYQRSEYSKEWTPMFDGKITSIETDSKMFSSYKKFNPHVHYPSFK
jgi:hypothetical protein